MAGLRLGGLASGMDTEAVIAQLMALEARPKTRMLAMQRAAEGRKSALEDVARQLRALSTAIADLRSATTWSDVQKVTSSDDSRVAARAVGPAPAGNVSVEVTQLARAEQRYFTWGTAGDGFSIDGVVVEIKDAATAQEAAAMINAASGITVYAGVVNDQLVLTGKELGRPIAVENAGGLTQTDVVAAQKTEYTLNGVAQEPAAATVVQPAGFPGVELTLKALTAGVVTVSVGAPTADAEKVKAKVKAFVDVYNATVDLVRGKLGESKAKSPQIASDYAKGQLRNDASLSRLLTDLRQAVGPVADSTTAIDTLAEIGVAIESSVAGTKTSAEALAGKLRLDEAKLASALAADSDAIERLLGKGQATGVSQTLERILEPLTTTATGYLARSTESADRDIARAKDRQVGFDRRLALREERLRSMFTAMEAAMNASQSQSSWLAGQLGGLSSRGE